MGATTNQHTVEPDPSPGFSKAARSNYYHDPEQRFTIVAPPGRDVEHFLKMDAYSAATAYVAGQYEVQGDLVAAVRMFARREHSTVQALWHSIAARLSHKGASLETPDGGKQSRDIQFHYDRSNQFYSRFLDSRMQYSAGDFSDPRRSLEEAQLEKLDQVCRELRLESGERFLDVGCGWGGLVIHAAERFGVTAVGCTLSPSQREFAMQLVKQHRLAGRVSIELRDYREIKGHFAKIASVGMFEHVGQRRLREYFESMRGLLEDDGMFLNRGIVRPEGVADGPETLFLQRNVFPGGELEHLADIIREAGNAGFEIRRMEDFRQDYALTCRAWVARIEQNSIECRGMVGESTYRTWLLYLAASAECFESGVTDAVQILLRKSPRRAGDAGS